MIVYEPLKYVEFVKYCNKRKSFCKSYHKLKKLKGRGAIGQKDYLRGLQSIHRLAIELDIKYFDILPMRL